MRCSNSGFILCAGRSAVVTTMSNCLGPGGLKGVHRAEVSFRNTEAWVTFDPAPVNVDQLIQAVDKLGFRASLKRGG